MKTAGYKTAAFGKIIYFYWLELGTVAPSQYHQSTCTLANGEI